MRPTLEKMGFAGRVDAALEGTALPEDVRGDLDAVREALYHFKHHWTGERDPDAALTRIEERLVALTEEIAIYESMHDLAPDTRAALHSPEGAQE